MVRAFTAALLALAGTTLLAQAGTTGLVRVESGDFLPDRSLQPALMASECGGRNESPALAWSDFPNGTKSFAVVLHDADAPLPGGFYHWVVYNLPRACTGSAAIRRSPRINSG